MGSSQSSSDIRLDRTPDGLRAAKAQRGDQAILIILSALDDSSPCKFHRSIALKLRLPGMSQWPICDKSVVYPALCHNRDTDKTPISHALSAISTLVAELQ